MAARSRKWLAGVGAAAALLATPAVSQDKSAKLHDVMAKSMKEMQQMSMTGDVDRDFAMMMKQHHRSGIEMAQVQAREGKDPQLRQQAQKIIEGQKKELAELDRWLEAKGKGASSKPGGSAESGSAGHSSHGSR